MPDQSSGEELPAIHPIGDPIVDGAASTTGASVLSGGIWNTASTIIPQLNIVVISIVAARVLQPVGMGRQSFIAFTELSIVRLLTGGLSISLMRFIGETIGRGRRDAARSLVLWAWRIAVVAAVVGGGSLVAVGLAGHSLRSAWVLAGVATSLSVLQTVPSALLIGLQRWRAATGVGLAMGIVGTIATVILLAAGGGIAGMFLVEAAVAAVSLAWIGILSMSRLSEMGDRAGPAGDLKRRVASYAGKMSINVLFGFVVWRRVEFFFLKRYSTDTQIAYYSVAFAFVAAAASVYNALAGVITPAIATLFGAGEIERIRSGASRALRLIMLLTLPALAWSLALGPAAIRLVFGQSYRGAGPILLILLTTLPVIPLHAVSSAVLVGLGEYRMQLRAAAVAAVVNLGLDFVLVPRLASKGAALGNAAAQIIYAVLVFSAAYKAGLSFRARSLAAGTIAAAASGLGGWALLALLGEGVGVVVGAFASVAIYLLLAGFLRVLPADDAAWVQEVAGRRAWGFVGRVARLIS